MVLFENRDKGRIILTVEEDSCCKHGRITRANGLSTEEVMSLVEKLPPGTYRVKQTLFGNYKVVPIKDA